MQTFFETPCSVLKGQVLDDDAYFISTGFLPTLRIKQWKPLDNIGKLKKSGSNYCYVNMEDYSMKGVPPKACEAATFANAPFISNTFIDKKQDATHSIAYEKCILEIDPSKTNDETLNTFWHTMGSNDCSAMVSVLQASNNSLEAQIAEWTARLNGLLQIKKTNDATLKAQLNELASIKPNIQRLEIDNENLRNEITNQTHTFNNNTKILYDTKVSCQNTAAQLNTSIDFCTTQLTKWTSALSNAKVTYSKSNLSYEKQQVQFGTNVMALSNIMEQYIIKSAEEAEMAQLYRTSSNNNYKCQVNLRECTTNLATCTTQDNASKASGVQYYTKWNACTANMTTCSNNLGMCAIKLPPLDTTNKSTIASYQVCINDKIQCTDNLTKDKQVEIKSQFNIDEWTRTHANCSPYMPRIENLKQAIADILVWCRFPIENNKQLQQGWIDASAAAVQNIADQATACTTGLSTLPTLVDIPKDFTIHLPSSNADAKGDKAQKEPITKVHLYDGINYGGTLALVGKGDFSSVNGGMGAITNDALKSVKIPVGWSISLYEHSWGGYQYDTQYNIPNVPTVAGWGVTTIRIT